jgi:sugar transferase (PEP-CTERM system associated)
LSRRLLQAGSLAETGLFAICCVCAMLLAVALQLGPYGVSAVSVLVPAIGFAAIMTGLGTAFGLFRTGERKSLGVVFSRTLLVLAVGFPIAYVFMTLVPDGGTARSVLGYASLYTLASMVIVRPTVLAAVSAGAGPHRVLIVGTGPEALAVEQTIEQLGPQRPLVVGFYPTAAGEASMPALEGRAPCFPSSVELATLVERFKVREVIVAVREQRGGVLPLRELLDCRITGVPVRDLSAFYERVRGEVPIDSLKASWLIYGDGFVQHSWRTFTKRAFDIVIGLALLILALPVLALAMIAIFMESGAPVFFRQERVGLGGRPFMCLKLRTMRADAERDGVPRWAVSNDARVTRVGKWLRKLRIDEIPQLINVLGGEMSLVGPRPERPTFVDQLREEIRFYDVRHSIKPGVTGWAQVRYSYGASVEDAQRKLQYDLFYVKNHSLALDVLILIETVRVVLFGEGAQ